jgi:hypothetical protein
MKNRPCLIPCSLTVVCLALLASAATAQSARTVPQAPASAPKIANATVPVSEIPQSVFVIPANPKEGRNPFFPQSTPVAPVVRPKDVDMSGIILNGITSPPKRSAMINGRTFEVGEPGEIKLPNGAKVLIKCEEIKIDSAVIILDGQRRELRMRGL